MSFKDFISKVEKETEETQRNLEVHKRMDQDSRMEPFEILGLITEVKDQKGGKARTIVQMAKPAEDGEKVYISTNQTKDYFEDYIGETVVLSGLMTEDDTPMLYVSSCFLSWDYDGLFDACTNMSRQEKRDFWEKIKGLPPELQKDLTKKRAELSNHEMSAVNREMPVNYLNMEEMDVLYEVLEPVIPAEFRTEYSRCKQMMEREISNSEKRNSMKVISNIMCIDWINQYYKEIDVDDACRKMKAMHIGHEAQLEELKTLLLTCNRTRKAPKTINFVGRSCGCGSLAVAFAKAIGRKYVEIDFSGRRTREADPENLVLPVQSS